MPYDFLVAFGVENKKKLGKCVLPGAFAWNRRVSGEYSVFRKT